MNELISCVRSSVTNQFSLLNNTLPFNKYAFLTTHNSSRNLPAFEPAMDTLIEIEAFLSANPSEIVTLILEDYVHTPNGLTKLFTDAGLVKYWFPVTSMPQNGQDWPLVSDMVTKNQRLLVFTSIESKQADEGIAYQWNFMVENQYGDGGMEAGNCFNRGESSLLNDTSKSLVLVNYFPTLPIKLLACGENAEDLYDMINTCYAAAGNRWANFVAVDFYKRSEGGGTFQAVDTLNGELLCGCNDVHSCRDNVNRIMSILVMSSLRARIFSSILIRKVEFFDRYKVGELTALLTSDLGSLKSIVSDNISRDRGFRALSEASNSTLCKSNKFITLLPRIEPPVFAALVPNSAEKSLKEVMEEIMGDHEMMDFAFVDDDVDGGWTVTSVHSIKTIV
ncbi:PI-PLC X domain-containing protein-like [Heracleum sosnowskyi]|uniref:PI-PLC X domain-containing protein-like n=1 Tax=Heracleum sosnowskyi TaxID=360622 RepID=A0AAD8N5D5_9APIA|nr:PI-PLC X domain-containing protein-like [Heracleum sosnowskyi]